MSATITITVNREVEVKYLRANCDVRYWEDAKVNGVEDTEGTLIPFRFKDTWRPVIELETGKILAWPEGMIASIHYKVCDAGSYELLDDSMQTVKEISGYVPSIMYPEGNGFGDYVIMEIDGTGQIQNWKVDLTKFRDGDE